MLRIASKLEYYRCSSYYVTHPVEGDILQNLVVIINNHLPLKYDAKDYSWLFFIYYFVYQQVVHNIAINLH